MASLQGYLMRYKAQPQSAVRDASDWVERELGENGLEDGSRPESPDDTV